MKDTRKDCRERTTNVDLKKPVHPRSLWEVTLRWSAGLRPRWPALWGGIDIQGTQLIRSSPKVA